MGWNGGKKKNKNKNKNKKKEKKESSCKPTRRKRLLRLVDGGVGGRCSLFSIATKQTYLKAGH